MSVVRGNKTLKVVYPAGCKEVTDELGKDELVRRLKLIARAFQDMGQEDYEEYTGLAVHLATDFFMDHPNKDVRLLVACCIADVFRIFAPEAPYRDAVQLKDIFMFLIKQLRGLEDPNSPTFKRYFYLLENLAWVKSFNICIELDDNQEIFCSLFQLVFSVINDRHTSKVKNFMLDMMAPLLSEADTVSQELLDILLLNIVEPHKTQNRQAYNLAKELLMRTCNSIEPYIQAFFNNALMLGKTSESELSNHLYDLIYELNAIAPSVLLAVLPQLEFKLKSNEETERKQVTKILSKMFSDQGSNLAEQNKQLWNCFLGRFNDISITVRTLCVSSAQNFVLYHPELVKDIVEQIKSRQHDAEETVRIEVVNTLLNIAKKNIDCMTEELLNIVKERTRDKKFKIRRDALLGLSNLYKTIILSEGSTQAQLDKINFVKDKVFHAYYNTNAEDKLLVERLFNMCLVPYTLPPSERMKRLYQMYATLDENAVKAFGEMMKYRHKFLKTFHYITCKNTPVYIRLSEFQRLINIHSYLGTSVRTLVRQILETLETTPKMFPFHAKLNQIARTLPDSPKSFEQLKLLIDILRDDRRIRTYMVSLVSSDCTCKRANDTVKEILKKLGGGHPSSSQSQILLYNTVKYLLERIAPVMIDAQSLMLLVAHIDDAVKGQGTIADGIVNAGEKGVQLLMCFSSVFPGYFKTEETFETLITFLKDEEEVVADTALQIFANAGLHIEELYPDTYAKLLPILQTTSKIGNPKQAKHAIRCINAIASNKETVFSQIFEHVRTNLHPDSANFITSIVALGHISWLCPLEFGNSMKAIVSKNIVKDLLMVDRTSGPESMESWYADHLVSEETNAKLQAMKLLMRWLLGLRNNNNNSGTSTLRLLYTVIVHEGDLMERGMINKPELARLRLQAGCCMLKIAEEPVFADIITREQFQALALLINDSCYHVRLKFAAKLHKGLIHLRLPLEYMCIFSLAANDPLRERRAYIKKCIQVNVQKRREYLKQNPALGGKMFQYLPDYAMPYTIHLLAHDPDLKYYDDLPALKNIKECLWFMMEPLVARSEDYNYQFFRRLIENIKQTKDAQGPDDDETNMKLYAVCDVALGLLSKNLTNVVLKETNVDPALPTKLFTQPDKSTINAQIYLPKDFNFDKKKGLVPVDEKPPVPNRGGRPPVPESVETIIVKSPGPVINPNPTCPRETKAQRAKKAKADQVSESSQEPAEQQSTGTSSPTSTTDTEAEKAPARRKAATSQDGKGQEAPKTQTAQTAPPKRGARNKKESADSSQATESSISNKDTESQESMDTSQETSSQDTTSQSADTDSTPSPPPKKRILKRTLAEAEQETDKNETQSGKAKKVSNASDAQDKGGREKSARSTKGQKRQQGDSSQEEEKGQGSATKKRKVGAENEDTTKKGKGKAAAKETDSESAPSSRTSSRAPSSEKSPLSQSTTNSSFKSPSSPAPKATPKKKAARAVATLSKNTVTRGKLKEKPSPGSKNSSASSSPASTPKKTPTKTASKAPTKKSPSKNPAKKLTIKISTSNVRRAKPLTNGTASDDTDSSGSSKKSAALSKAIQKGKLGKETKKKPVPKGKKK